MQSTALRSSGHEAQTAPSSEEPPVVEQGLGSTAVWSEMASPSRESQLTPIAEAPGKEVRWSEEDNPLEYNVQSEHNIIHEIPEDFNTTPVEPEQSYTTAPVSFGPLVGYSISRMPSPNVCVGKGKGCAVPLPPQGKGSSSHWDKRE
jgi:hypothetical protein